MSRLMYGDAPATASVSLPRVDLFLDRVRALCPAALATVLSRYRMLDTRRHDPGILALMDVASQRGRQREIDEVVDAAYTVALDLAQRHGVELVPILDTLVSATVGLALVRDLPDVQRALYEPFATEIPPEQLLTGPLDISVRYAGAA